ncbi:sensor domain-containing protein [Oceanobacillus damuensis]|uniref:sensor domain-containing protein n=1 Tax=Oceanobacillus damuensis TaxID=937928 RepID=UPI000831E729|nr:sensor domain-containing diguanylate cyclase [Oceanobacillus damuensis]
MTSSAGFIYEEVLMNGIQNMIFVIRVDADLELYYEFLNHAAMKNSGLTDAVIGSSIKTVYVDDREKSDHLYEKYWQVAATKEKLIYHDYYLSASGDKQYSKTQLTPLCNDQGICTHIVALVTDITEERITKLENKGIYEKLKESEKRFRIIAENSHDFITLLDNEGKIMYASPSYKENLGLDENELLDQLYINIIHPEHQMKLLDALSTAINEDQSCKLQFKHKHNTKGWIWVELSGTPVFDENMKLIHLALITRDITHQKEYESKLEHFALHDVLTGLPNRRYFNQKLATAMASSKNGLAVLMIDVDNLKQFNDQMGHDFGDKVIQIAAKRLDDSLQKKDTAARLGGDEFAVILPNINTKENALEIVKRIHNAIQEPWYYKESIFKITASIGIALVSDEKATPVSILKNADLALYEAKSAGKNNIQIRE